METRICDSSHPLSILGFSSTLEPAKNTNWIHKCAATGILAFFINNGSRCCSKTLNSAIVNVTRTKQIEDVTSYAGEINFLDELSVTADVVAEMDPNILCFTERTNMTPTEYTETLWNKAFCCSLLVDVYILKGIFIELLHGSVRQTMHSYWNSRKSLPSLADASCQFVLKTLAALSSVDREPVYYGQAEQPPVSIDNQREVQKTTTVAHVHEGSTSGSQTQRPLMTLLPAMESARDQAPFSLMLSVDNFLFWRLWISMVHLMSRCELRPQQLCSSL